MLSLDILGTADIVAIDYKDLQLSPAVRKYKPAVFGTRDNGYWCLSGEDLQKGVVGIGSSIEGALHDWETALRG